MGEEPVGPVGPWIFLFLEFKFRSVREPSSVSAVSREDDEDDDEDDEDDDEEQEDESQSSRLESNGSPHRQCRSSRRSLDLERDLDLRPLLRSYPPYPNA